MSAIFAVLSMLGGALAIVSIAHSQQMVDTLLLDVSTSLTYFSAPPKNNSSNDVDYHYNFIGGLFEKTVLDPHAAYAFVDHWGIPTSRNASFSVVQLGDLNGGVALNFKNTVIFASNCVAYNSLTHAHTQAIGFDENKINFRGHNPLQ